MLPIKIDLPDGFLEEETREGYLISRDMKKVWAVELDLLAEFDRVCKLLNLSYVLDSGTLLGAIRHKGFIPWDDDIDVIMLRHDYDILVKEGAKYFSSPYFLQTPYSDRAYFRPHAQLRNSKTTAMLSLEGKGFPFNQGIFIDIFVLDGLTQDTKLLEEQFNQQNRLKFIFIFGGCPYSNTFIRTVIKKLTSRFFGLFYKDYIDLYRKHERISKKYSRSKYVDKISYRKKAEDVKFLKRKWFLETVDVEFEKKFFPVPKYYDKVLKEYYGDNYMIPQKSPTYHGDTYFDTERSYKEVLTHQP